jgi:hypothetical protein
LYPVKVKLLLQWNLTNLPCHLKPRRSKVMAPPYGTNVFAMGGVVHTLLLGLLPPVGLVVATAAAPVGIAVAPAAPVGIAVATAAAPVGIAVATAGPLAGASFARTSPQKSRGGTGGLDPEAAPSDGSADDDGVDPEAAPAGIDGDEAPPATGSDDIDGTGAPAGSGSAGLACLFMPL